MIDAQYCKTMAIYNQWMNERLYSVCRSLSDEVRKEDRAAFFASIHSTLNHILFGDLAFMSRFTGVPAEVPKLEGDLHDDFEELAAERSALDARILDWCPTLQKEWLAESLTYESKVDGITRTVPKWVLVTHMFNHAIHHRGQITTLLSQIGVDVGTTDLPFMSQFSAIE